jgi:hypothetical protein
VWLSGKSCLKTMDWMKCPTWNIPFVDGLPAVTAQPVF